MCKKKRLERTDFLLPSNNFVVGLGSIMNLAGGYFEYNHSKSAEEADAKALTSDWLMVGKDLRTAKKKIDKQYKLNLPSLG